jgi:hypothetical protein
MPFETRFTTIAQARAQGWVPTKRCGRGTWTDGVGRVAAIETATNDTRIWLCVCTPEHARYRGAPLVRQLQDPDKTIRVENTDRPQS